MTDDKAAIGRADLPDRGIPDDLPTRLHTAIGWMHRRFRTAAPTHGLPYSAMTLVNRLRLAGPQSPATLAAWDGSTPAVISQTAARLIEGGFVERDDSGSGTVLRVTGRGAEVSEQWYAEAVRWVGRHTDALDREERDVLERATDILIGIARS